MFGEGNEFFGAVLLFMVGTVFALIWGRRRGEDPEKTLQQKLLKAATKKVVKYLEKNGSATVETVEKLLRGITVRDSWYRKLMRIDDPKTYAKGLMRILVENGTVKYAGKDGYCLPEKKEEKYRAELRRRNYGKRSLQRGVVHRP